MHDIKIANQFSLESYWLLNLMSRSFTSSSFKTFFFVAAKVTALLDFLIEFWLIFLIDFIYYISLDIESAIF